MRQGSVAHRTPWNTVGLGGTPEWQACADAAGPLACLSRLGVRRDPQEFAVRDPGVATYFRIISALPKPSRVKTTRLPGSTGKVGMMLPVITTIPDSSVRPCSIARLATQASAPRGSSVLPSPKRRPSISTDPCTPASESPALNGVSAPSTTPAFQELSTIIES